MTRAQIEAALERVRVAVHAAWPDILVDDDVCGRIVSAVLGHPDGRVPRQPAGAVRKARRFAR